LIIKSSGTVGKPRANAASQRFCCQLVALFPSSLYRYGLVRILWSVGNRGACGRFPQALHPVARVSSAEGAGRVGCLLLRFIDGLPGLAGTAVTARWAANSSSRRVSARMEAIRAGDIPNQSCARQSAPAAHNTSQAPKCPPHAALSSGVPWSNAKASW
jgi:hypothetical protein